jgi:hypothetical protein
LLERVSRVQPVDLGQPDGGEKSRDRQQIRICEGDRVPRDQVRRKVEREEEARVCERGRRDDVPARDVDTREADRRQDSDDD